MKPSMDGFRGGWGIGPNPLFGNHKLVYVSLEILVWTPLEKRFDPLCPIASRGRSIRFSVKYVDDKKKKQLSGLSPT